MELRLKFFAAVKVQKTFLMAMAVFFWASLATAEIKFESTQIELTHGKNKKKITVEVAESEAQMQQGLMNRSSLKKDQGMIFIFQDDMIRSFWMKNTIIDLSIAFVDKNFEIIDIQDMKATSMLETNPPSYYSRKPARYAIEMTKGWFAKNKFPVGTKMKFMNKKESATKVQH